MQRLRRAIVFPYSDGPAGRGQILPALLWQPPDFGGRCVCCSEPAGSGELNLFAEREEHKTSLAVPVCPACEHHASSGRPSQAFAVVAIFVALAVSALAWFDPSVLPFAANPLVAFIVSAPVISLSIGWLVFDSRRTRIPTDRAHHPDPQLDVGSHGVIFRTTNEALVDALLQLNPTAVRGSQPAPRNG